MNAAPVAQRALHYIKTYYVFMAGLMVGLACGIILEAAFFNILLYGHLPFGIGH